MSETYEERLRRENEEREAKHKELRELGGKLTLDGFTLVPAVIDPNDSAYDRYYSPVKLTHADGRMIALTWAKERGKVTVAAWLEHGMHNHKPHGTSAKTAINVSVSKSPETISREIERRLLPEYTALFNACRERMNEANAYAVRTDKAIRAVAKAFNAEVRKPSGTGDTWNGLVSEVSWYRTAGGYGDAKASDGRIDLNLRDLTVAQCEAIAKLLRK